MRRYLTVVMACAFATAIGVSAALAGGASDSSGEGSHCYLFLSLPGGTFAQAMVNDSDPDEVLNKVWEFIDKYENEGGTLELAVGNIDDTVCAPSAPEGCPGGGGIF